MADLVCVAFDDPTAADRALAALTAMQKEHLIQLKDACVVIRPPEGEIQLKQAVPLTRLGATTGAASGALWGGLIGLLFLNPLAGMAIGAGVGAASGAVAGKLSDYGIDDGFIEELGGTIKPGSSALFLLVQRSPPTRSCRSSPSSGAACSRPRSATRRSSACARRSARPAGPPEGRPSGGIRGCDRGPIRLASALPPALLTTGRAGQGRRAWRSSRVPIAPTGSTRFRPRAASSGHPATATT